MECDNKEESYGSSLRYQTLERVASGANWLRKVGIRFTIALAILAPSALLVFNNAGASTARPLMTCFIVDGQTVCGSPQWAEATLSVTNPKTGKAETSYNNVETIVSGGKTAVIGCTIGIVGLAGSLFLSDGAAGVVDGNLADYEGKCVIGGALSVLKLLF
jgi:hypothetical protein